MKVYGTPLLAAALLTVTQLAGCGSGDPAPVSTATATAVASPQMPVMGSPVPVLAFGDSLFTGYGLGNGEGYPARLEAALRAKGLNARMANASVSGDTTADGLQRLTFALDSQEIKPELVLLSLGGNDALRGLPPEQTRKNLDAILGELDRRGIRVILMGMLAPPNMGSGYRAAFDPIYPSLARKHDVVLVPFFLQPLMGKADLVQRDHIHPTARGVEEMVAATLPTVAGAMPKDAARPPR